MNIARGLFAGLACRNTGWRNTGRLPILAMIAFLSACGGGDVPDGGNDMAFDSSLNIEIDEMDRSPSGLYTRDLTEGSGEAATAGRRVTVHYTGWLTNGTQFDSSRNGSPFEFTLGAGEVIPGWDEGVAGMMIGGRRQLVIPPALAYGSSGAGGVIPPNADLVFDVELLGLQ